MYGLRYAYRVFGMKEMRVMLPSIERPKKLPVVLSHKEIKQLLRAPKLLKHRLVLAMLYGCGLRNFELRNVQRKDLDFDRKMLHIRQGKGRKDRYVPLSDILIRGLKKYLLAERKPLQHNKCPCCKKGKLITIAIFTARGPPYYWQQKLKKQMKSLSK